MSRDIALFGAIVYLVGLAFFAGGNNTAAHDKRRFWPALLFWPVTLLIGAAFTGLKRL